jgi:putative ABC transport system permease protein
VLVIVGLIVLVATALPAWRTGRVPTTAALAPVPPRRGRRSRLAALAQRLGVGPVGEAGVAQAFGRPTRSFLTALALGVAVVAVVVTSSVDHTIDGVFGDPARVGDPEEVSVSVPPGDEASVASTLDAAPGVTSWFTETYDDLVVGDQLFLGIAMGGDVEDAGFVVREGHAPVAAGEAIVGYGLIQRLGIGVGDELDAKVGDAPIRLHVVGWYSEAEDGGEVLRYRLEDLQAVAPEKGIDRYGVNVADGTEPADVSAQLEEALGPAASVEVVTTEGSDEIDTFRAAFLLVAALVLAVAFANLGSTMLLMVRERTRDLAVLRAVGMKPAQTRAIVVTGAVLISLVAALIGLPLGLAAARVMNDGIGRGAGFGPGIGTPPPLWVLLALVPVTAAVAGALGALSARRAARAEIAELVRYE